MARPNDFNSKIIAEFRASGGTVGGPFAGSDILLLHHTGARTGTERVSPLAFQRVGESLAVFASKAGAPQNPAWYHNLLAHPDASVEVGTETLASGRVWPSRRARRDLEQAEAAGPAFREI